MSPSAHRARRKYAAALLSPSSLHHLRVPAQFAAQLGGEEDTATGNGRAAVVLLVSPFGKVWRAELLRRAGGAGGASSSWQLGGAWAEFAAAHGIAAGWSVVFRLERRGVATVRAFDTAGCLKRFCTAHAGVAAGKNRPRFIRVLHTEDLEKMRIPNKFVQEHLTGSWSSTQKAMLFSPLGKFWHVELERGQSGVLLGDGWAQFLTAHNLSEGNLLLFRYEDNMVFTVEAFLQNGYSKEYGATAAGMTDDLIVKGASTMPKQGDKELGVSYVKKKKKTRNESTRQLDVYHKKPNLSPISAKKVGSQKKLVCTVSCHSLTKRVTGFDLTTLFTLKGSFCSSAGLLEACEITLKTSVGNTRSWSVCFKNAINYGYLSGPGLKRFCSENNLKEGRLLHLQSNQNNCLACHNCFQLVGGQELLSIFCLPSPLVTEFEKVFCSSVGLFEACM